MFKTHSPMELKEPQVRVIFWQSLFRSLKQLYKAQPQKCYLMMELCLVPRCLSLNENVRARKVGRRQPFPWSLAVHHQSLAFLTRLYDEKNQVPEEEAEWN